MRNLLKSVLRSNGFEIEDSGDWLLAKKKDLRYYVGFFTRATLDARKVRELPGKKIIISLDDEGFEHVKEKDVLFLSWKSLEEEFGRVLSGEMDISATAFYKIINPGDDLVTVERLGTEGETIIRPAMGLEDIRELGRKTVGGFRYTLELVPHYIFSFDCELVLDTDRVRKSGLVGVNAITRKADLWKQNYETVASLNHAHKKLEPVARESEAFAIAKRFATEKSAMEFERVEEKEHAVVIEKKKVKPKEEQMRMEKKGLVYLPVWGVEGTNGVMIVNAASGKIIEEEYYR